MSHPDRSGGKDDLDAVFAGVAGAADDELHHHQVLDREAVLLERRDLRGMLAIIGMILGPWSATIAVLVVWSSILTASHCGAHLIEVRRSFSRLEALTTTRKSSSSLR
jgi:hypothetical protein